MQDATLFLFGLGYVALGVAVLVIAKFVRDAVTPYRLSDQLTGKDNPAVGLAVAGYLAAALTIYIGAASGPGLEEGATTGALLMEMLVVVGYAGLGIVLLNLGAMLVDRLVLGGFRVTKELTEDRNVGTGAVMCGSYVATGLVVAGSVYGQSVGPWWQGPASAVVFFLLGQAVLVLFGVLYRWMTRYDLHDEIERDNVAAGAAFGLTLAGIGIVLTRATGQNFAEVVATYEVGLAGAWSAALQSFAYYAVGGLLVIGALRFVTDALLLRGTTIDEEIGRDKNLAAAFIEGAAAIGVAGSVALLL